MKRKTGRTMASVLAAVLVVTGIPVNTSAAYAKPDEEIIIYADDEQNVEELQTEAYQEPLEDADIVEADRKLTDADWPEPAADWYTSYEYELSGSDILLHNFTGAVDISMVVPATATIDGVTYHTVLAPEGLTESMWNESNMKANQYGHVLYMKIDNGVRTSQDASYLFCDLYTLTQLEVTGLDTSATVKMDYMFDDLQNLTELDVSTFNTSNVTSMKGMFSRLWMVEDIKFGEFDTSKVTDMSYMFDFSVLKSLDLGFLETSNVTNMSNMLKLGYMESIDLSPLDTSNVTDMSFMFAQSSGLKTIDLSKLNTSKVTNMSGMFANCYGLETLDISKLDTSKVTDMSRMFESCQSLKKLTIGDIDTSNVTTMANMFFCCNNVLTALDVSGLDTQNVTDMSGMFDSLLSLTALDLKNFNTSKVTDMNSMFSSCDFLEELDLSSFDTSGVTDMHSMFYSCAQLKSLDVSNFNTSKVTNMSNMFRHCSWLRTLDLKDFDTSAVTNMSYMFAETGIETIDLSTFDTSNVKDMSGMFTESKSLLKMDMSKWNTSKVTNFAMMFSSCWSLASVNLKGIDTSSAENIASMFSDCAALVQVDVRGFNTSKVDYFSGFAEKTRTMKFLDLRKWDFSKSTYAEAIIRDSVVEELYLPAAAFTNEDFTKYTYDPSELKTIYYEGTEAQWSALNNTVPAGVSVVYGYTGDGPEYVDVPDPEPVGPQPGPSDDTVVVTGIQLGDHIIQIAPEETYTLRSKIYPLDASNTKVTWNWSSPDEGAIEVISENTPHGEAYISDYTFKAVKEGTVSITAITEDGPFTDTCTVIIGGAEPEADPIPVSGISLSKTRFTAVLGEADTLTLVSEIMPSDATDIEVEWTADDTEGVLGTPEIRSIEGTTRSVFKAPIAKSGSAIVTVSTKDGIYAASCEVLITEKGKPEEEREPVPVTGINLDKTAMTLAVGDSASVTSEIAPANADNMKVKWTCSPSGLIMVSSEDSKADSAYSSYRFTALKAGTAVITATSLDGDMTAECTVTIRALDEPDPDAVYNVSFWVDQIRVYSEKVDNGDTLLNVQADPGGDTDFLGWYDAKTSKFYSYEDLTEMPIYSDMKLVARFAEVSGKNARLIVTMDNDLYMIKGQNYALAKKNEETGDPYNWQSSDAKIVSISSKYKAKAVSETNESIQSDIENDNRVVIYNGDRKDDENGDIYIPHIVAPVLSGKDSKPVKNLNLVIGEAPEQLGLGVDEDIITNYDVTWISSNQEIATVDDDGLVYPVAKGSCKVTAYVGGKSYICSVKVAETRAVGSQNGKAAQVRLSPLQTATLKYSDNFKIANATITDLEDTLVEIKKKNGKTDFYQNSVVRITPAGKVIGVGAGYTTLVFANGSDEREVTIEVKSPVNQETYMNAGGSKTLKYYNVKSAKARWETSDTGLITTAKNGKITAAKGKTGQAVVVCVYDPYHRDEVPGTGFTYTAKVSVEDLSIETDSQLKEVKKGTSYTLSLKANAGEEPYKIRMKDVYQSVVFESAKPAVAFVDEAGVVYARSKGSTSLKAKVNGKAVTIKVTVTDQSLK